MNLFTFLDSVVFGALRLGAGEPRGFFERPSAPEFYGIWKSECGMAAANKDFTTTTP